MNIPRERERDHGISGEYTERERERQTDRDRESGVEYFLWIYRETDIQTDRQTDRVRDTERAAPRYVRCIYE